MRVLPFALAACLLAAPALAAAPPAQPPTEVSPVTVMPPSDPPKLAASFPAAGQAIAPGVLVLSVTFDERMQDTGFGFGKAAAGDAPDCLPKPRLLDDGKTFVLLCTTQPGKTYGLALNATPAGGFVNIGGKRAAPGGLSFTTTTADPVRDLEDALKAAKLRPVDTPVSEFPGMHPPPAP